VAVIGSIPIPSGEHLSIEERVRLHSVLAESIAAGWKLFHTAGTVQVLAVGQAQLDLIQQVSSHLYPSVQPLFYSGVHRLIGASQYFQGRYDEAYREQEKAYIAALEGADTWNMAQSRGWQAYVLKARGNFADALQMADAALLGDGKGVQTRLDASEALLEHLPGYHEEFDRVSWLQQAGMCALSLQQYDVAVTRLQQALDELPAQWTLRTVSTAIPLASALTQQKELSRALAIAGKTLPIVKSSQSPTLVQEFTTYLQTGLLASFPNDSNCRTFVAEAQRRLAMVE
jgi:tetratricopeptide (TPR) repeat protein